MSDTHQLLREAAQQALEDLQTATSFTSIKSRNRCPKTIERLREALAQPAEGGEPLFVLHCGQIDSSGEQDEWETEANGQQRVDDFCRLHPGQKIRLYTAPPARQEQQPAEGRKAPVWTSIQIASWIGSQLMHEPSMFERAAVCKFVRSLGRHPTLLKHSPASQEQANQIPDGYAPVTHERLDELIAAENELAAMKAQQPKPQPADVTDSMIREAFLTNGFTIKDGHSDLKPYVYAAARAILALRPVQAQQPIKDHQIAQIVNQLRDIAIEFGGTQQLRERIAVVIVPVLKAQQPSGREVSDEMSADQWRSVVASLGSTLRRLSFAAQTSGGTAGPDAGLMAAIEHASDVLSLRGIATAVDAPLLAAQQPKPQPMPWPRINKRMEYAAQDEFHILPPRLKRLWARMEELADKHHGITAHPTKEQP